MLVLAVDVGIKNLALCAIDSASGEIVHWANEALSSSAYQPMHNVQYVHEFLARNAALFDRADEIVVEKQMRVNMRIIEAVIHSRYFDKCKVVHARTIKAAFGLSRGNYTLNKRASVEFVLRHLEDLGQPQWREHFARAKKRDDLADAYIMAHFFSTALIFARIVTYGKSEARPDTTGNTMQDAQLERALNTGANELDIRLNSNLTVAQKQAIKDQWKRFQLEGAKSVMGSNAAQASRGMATQPGVVRSAYA